MCEMSKRFHNETSGSCSLSPGVENKVYQLTSCRLRLRQGMTAFFKCLCLAVTTTAKLHHRSGLSVSSDAIREKCCRVRGLLRQHMQSDTMVLLF